MVVWWILRCFGFTCTHASFGQSTARWRYPLTFTWIQHFFIWGSIAFWYVFLLIYGALPPKISTTAHQVFVEACAPSPFYWLGTLLVVVSCLVPYFLYRAFQTEFKPMIHDVIQRRRWEESELEASGDLSEKKGKLREENSLLGK